jgi:hypothetical protein
MYATRTAYLILFHLITPHRAGCTLVVTDSKLHAYILSNAVNACSHLSDCLILKSKVVSSSGKAVIISQSTRYKIPEDTNIHHHRFENMKSHINTV